MVNVIMSSRIFVYIFIVIDYRSRVNSTHRDNIARAFLGINSGIRDWQSFVEVYHMGRIYHCVQTSNNVFNMHATDKCFSLFWVTVC